MTNRPIDRIRAERQRAYSENGENFTEFTDPLEQLAIEEGARPDRVKDMVSMIRDHAALLNDDGTAREVAREVVKDLLAAHADLFRQETADIHEAESGADVRTAITLKRRRAYDGNSFPRDAA